MNLVVLAQLRFLWRTRGSLLSALLGMTIGVASVTGVHLLSAEIAQRVESQARPFGPADLYLQRAALTEQDYFAVRKRWRAGELSGVAAIFPLLEGQVELGDEPHLLVGTDVLALSAPIGEALSRPAAGVVPGPAGESYARWLSSNAVYLPRALADTLAADAIVLGDKTVEVLGFSAPYRVLLADLPTAQAVLGQELSRIGVVLAPDARRPDFIGVLRRFFGNLFPGAVASPAAQPLTALDSTWQQIPAAADNPTQQLLQSVLFNVAALSVLALVVAWLLTYQVACHALGRRRPMFLRLQSLGVSRGRLQRLTFIEGIVLGLFATAAGLALGLVLANSLLAAALGSGDGFALPLTGFVWFKAFVSGVGVAGFSYSLAANRSLFAPLGGSSVYQQPATASQWRHLLVLLILLLVFAWGLAGDTLVGAFACIVVCALALLIYLPVLAGWLWQRSRRLPVGRTSPLGVLGLRQILQGQELRLGVSALALALATALGISVMVESFRTAFLDMLDRRLSDDLVVVLGDNTQPAPPLLNAELEEELRDHSATTFWRGAVPVTALGIDGELEYADKHVELLRRFVLPEQATEPAQELVWVNESFARAQNLRAGVSIELLGRHAAAAVEIAGVFADYGDARPRLLGARSLALLVRGAAPLTELYVRTPQRMDLRAALGDLESETLSSVRDQTQVRAQSLEVFEQTFAITRALTWLALLVAVVALANALAAHSLQQQGTARQLRVLGLARSGQRRLRHARTLYVGMAALLLAVPLGLAIAALLCLVVNPRAFGWSFAIEITPGGVGWPLVGGLLGVATAALLGGIIARRETTMLARSPAVLGVLGVLLLLLGGCSGEQSATAGEDSQSAASASGVTGGLRVGSVLGGEADGFARATQVQEFRFPQDHGAHPDYKSEWWYLTCPLADAANGAEYGVQFTLFRQALVPPASGSPMTAQTVAGLPANPWRSGQVYMAHAALTGVTQARHVEASRFARGHPELAGVTAEPFAAWLEDWRLAAPTSNFEPSVAGQLEALQLAVRDSQFAIALNLQQSKPRVLQGDRGLSYKGSSEASYYYSLPRLAATGVVRFAADGEDTAVTGACWLDREWSTSVLADTLVGWDWFALQLNDGTEYMLFQLREAADPGAKRPKPPTLQDRPRRQGKVIGASGASQSIAAAELSFHPARYWRDEVGNDWPVEWELGVGERSLRIVAALDDQRMRSTIAYWEGLVWVFDGAERVGQGYLEMTGYAGH